MTKTSLDKSKIKILLLEGIHSSAAEKFQADGYTNIEYHQKALRSEELASAAADAYFVGIRSATQLDREFFDSASRLTGVGCFCIGTNQVDLATAARARRSGVQRAVFQHAQRRRTGAGGDHHAAARHPAAQRGGASRRMAQDRGGLHEVRGKTLGIVGYGHIGTQMGVLAESLGMQVIFYDIETRAGAGQCAAGAIAGRAAGGGGRGHAACAGNPQPRFR